MTSRDNKKPLAWELIYTMLAHDTILPEVEIPDSLSKAAPSILIGDLFAATRSI